MVYNTTNLTAVTNIYELTREVNVLSNGLYAVFFLISVFFVMFVAMKQYDTPTVFVASSFICMIVAAILHFLAMVNTTFLIIVFLLFVVSLIIKMTRGE